MRKAQQENLLEIMTSMQEMIEQIRTELEHKNVILAQNLLEECQQASIQIGTSIDKIEGEGTTSVSYLEDYCDLLFKVHEDILQDCNPNKVGKLLRKQLIKIENSIKNDIKIRKEVVFFPYKASMWDSLESVYLAAKADPDCDAYCVPIPYYDLKPDHSFGEMHYEGLEYPKNIECIDYRTYNFEERKPDIIYIHNPYDNWNLVTSVPTRFYSANLKKYTEELVYIPYFVLQEIEPEDQAAIENMKHFVWTPGVIHADKVIVQSENMKQIYVNEYLKAAVQNNLGGIHQDRKYLEKKFLGLGSPKLDKVKNTKKEDLEIPEEWMKIIQKPDGSWKKIIFYNTGIAALLQYGQQWVDKIEDVLRIFKENQDDVALLWRPHPLIENTMKSMKPEVMQKYMEIKQKYIAEGWGIYDETSDMDRAVVLSDGYYGDTSSVIALYEHIRKPIMIQKIQNNLDRMKVSSFIIEKKELWFELLEINGLFCKNENTNLVECPIQPIKVIPEYNCECTIKYNKYLILLPIGNNTEIRFFNRETKSYDYNISIDTRYCYCDSGVIIGKKLWIINNWSENPSVIILNLENKTIEKKITISKNLIWNSNIAGRPFTKDFVLTEKYLQFAMSAIPFYCEIDLYDYSVKMCKVECDLIGFSTFCFDGKYYWLSDENGVILKSDGKSVIEKIDIKNVLIQLQLNLSVDEIEIKQKYSGYKGTYMMFNSNVKIGNQLIWIPGRASHIICFNLINHEWSLLYEMPKQNTHVKWGNSWICSYKDDYENLFLFSLYENKIIEITREGYIEENSISKFELKDSYIENEGALIETMAFPFSLNNFINNKVSFPK